MQYQYNVVTFALYPQHFSLILGRLIVISRPSLFLCNLILYDSLYSLVYLYCVEIFVDHLENQVFRDLRSMSGS